MEFKKVYASLLDLFPQIDPRALRAVSIEHSKDVDAAVMAVLDEILPFFTEKSTPSTPLTRSISVAESSDVGIRQSLGNADDVSEPFYDAYDGHHVEDKISESTLLEKSHESEVKMCSDVYSPHESLVLIDENRTDTCQIQMSGDPQIQETISEDKFPECAIKTSFASISEDTVETTEEVDMYVDEKSDHLHAKEDINRILEACCGFRMSLNDENHLEESLAVADGNNPVDETSSTVADVTVRPLESIELIDVADMKESNLDDSNACLSTDTATHPEAISDIIVTEEESTLNMTMSQSSQIHVIDAIEEIIADARNNKKTLFSAMESIISLMSEVELKEQVSEQAKVEAAMGGADILNKVEDLKRMLQYAREANDMHAGEVYGEKAILATELRELQSRVCSLSDERDNSLAILDEMRQTLEVRVAAAENEIKSSEQEKLEKEKAARELLYDQELIMEKVVQESKILKQQAEENAKLQEFLVDRGRAVDALQGEIAVICQDVRQLKEKFDQRVPFSKSLFSSHTSFVLASSTSSLKSLVPDQVQVVPEGDDNLFEAHKNRVLEEDAAAKTLQKNRGLEEDAAAKALQDEGWEIFADAEINASVHII